MPGSRTRRRPATGGGLESGAGPEAKLAPRARQGLVSQGQDLQLLLAAGEYQSMTSPGDSVPVVRDNYPPDCPSSKDWETNGSETRRPDCPARASCAKPM